MSEGDRRSRAVVQAAVPPLRRLLPAVAAGAVSAAASIALLAASAWLIVRAAEQPPVLFLSLAIVGVRAFALARAVFRYLERLAGHDAAFRQLAAIRTGVYARMLPLAPDGLVGVRRGELLARFVDDVDELQNVSLRIVQPIVSAVLVLVAAVVGVGLLAPGAALVVGAVLAAGIVVALVAQRLAGAAADRRIAPLRGRLQSALVEHAHTREILLAYGAADASLARIDALGKELARAARARAAASGVVAAVMSAVGGIGAGLALLSAQPMHADGRLDGPTLAVLALVPLAIAEVAAALPPAATAWRTVRSSAERVATVVPTVVPVEIPRAPAHPAPAPRDAAEVPPTLRLRGVSVRWPVRPSGAGDHAQLGSGPVEANAIDDVGFELASGARLLIEGPSGSGKTTLAHALVRFLDYEGSYTIDGLEARDLDPAAVRRIVGLVEQRPWMFDEDLRQNLRFARDTATDDELLAVLDRVGLGEWAAERGGLDARVGERGALVSGGQAQRIALARAMLADFPVLVLDEPTASVDRAMADALLRELLEAAGSERSVVLISHTGAPDSLIDDRIELGAARRAPGGSGA